MDNMTKEELLKNYQRATEEADLIDRELTSLLNDWSILRQTHSDETIQSKVDILITEVESKRKEAASYYARYAELQKLEKDKQENALNNVVETFNTNPNEITITDGVLSSNANESHLIGTKKTNEELEEEKQALLNNLSKKVMNKEISLAEASKLVSDINTVYDVVSSIEEPTESKHK